MGAATLFSPPSSSVHGILQARMLEWVAIPSSRGSFRPRDRTCISCIAGGFFTVELPGRLHFLLSWSKCEDNMWSWFWWGKDKSGPFSGTSTLCPLLLFRNYVVSDSVTPWTVAHQACLCKGFPKQEYWSESPFPSPGDLPNPGIEPVSPALAGRFFTRALDHNPHFILFSQNDLILQMTSKKWTVDWKTHEKKKIKFTLHVIEKNHHIPLQGLSPSGQYPLSSSWLFISLTFTCTKHRLKIALIALSISALALNLCTSLSHTKIHAKKVIFCSSGISLAWYPYHINS